MIYDLAFSFLFIVFPKHILCHPFLMHVIEDCCTLSKENIQGIHADEVFINVIVNVIVNEVSFPATL